MGTTPFHETQQFTGITEACGYNDHTLCNGAGGRCRCDCHRMARDMATQAQSPIQVGRGANGSVANPLDKYCPICKVQRPSEENFCRKDGAKLSSLRCPECGTPGEADDSFCSYCGCPMKADDREMEAAATGNRLPEDSHEIPAGDIGAEAAMRVAMREVAAKTVPAPTRPKISMGMFK